MHVEASAAAAAAQDHVSAFAGDEESDVLSDVLRSMHLTGSMFFLVEASTPWSTHAPATPAFAAAVLPRAQHLISYHMVVAGSCWGGIEGRTPHRLEAGDILVIPHGSPYFLAAPPDVRPTVDLEASLAFFRRMAAGELPSVVVEGGGGPETTQFICGFLGCDARPFNPILAHLPDALVLRGNAAGQERISHLLEFALGELRERRLGGRAVLLRLSELLFIEAVRHHIQAQPVGQAGWIGGLRDAVVARALARLHAQPAQDWTLERLAADVGASRSALAERFSRTIGQPPMQYLAAWRMQLAAHLLAEPQARVKTVAEAIGYKSEAAFSRAFKKMAGVAPARWRLGDRGRGDHSAAATSRQ